MEVKTEANIKCPKCGHERKETMPTDACQQFYKCENCGETIAPKEDDCCVFCSYSDSKCPPKQLEEV